MFKCFSNKAGLHKAAMTSGIANSWIKRETNAQGPLRTQEDFVRFIRWQGDVLRHVVPVVLMAWSSRSNADEMPADLTGPRPAPLVSIQTLAEMLQGEMDAGHLAKRNAEAIAPIVIGSVWHFVFLGHVLRKTSTGLEENTFIEELARVVFTDLDPARNPRGKRRVRR